MIKKLLHIIKGWSKRWGIISVSKAEEKLADLRLKECKYCAFSSESKVLNIINGKALYEKQLVCTKCTCPVYQKTIVVNESCPINKW